MQGDRGGGEGERGGGGERERGREGKREREGERETGRERETGNCRVMSAAVLFGEKCDRIFRAKSSLTQAKRSFWKDE